MDEQTGEKTQNMLVDHLFQCQISPWPKTAKKRGFCTGARLMDRQTNQWTDRPSYRDAFLMDASKKCSGNDFVFASYMLLHPNTAPKCRKTHSYMTFHSELF